MNSFSANATVLVPSIIILLAIFFGSWLLIKKIEFAKAWNGMLGSLTDELNSKGLEMVNILLEIAFLTADKVAARKLGKVEAYIEKNKNKPCFFKKLPRIIREIHASHNSLEISNGDYARAEQSIENGLALVDRFSQKKDYEVFALLSIETAKAEEDIAEALANIGGIFYGLKFQSIKTSENEIINEAVKKLSCTLYCVIANGIAIEESEAVLNAIVNLDAALRNIELPEGEGGAGKRETTVLIDAVKKIIQDMRKSGSIKVFEQHVPA